MEVFSVASGQVINFDKSGILWSKNTNRLVAACLSKELGVKKALKDDKYLGTPLLIGKQKIRAFMPLINRLNSKIASWKGKLLSQAARTVLVQSVASAIPLYQMSCFEVPKTIQKKMDGIQRDFWWGKLEKKGVYLRAWSEICKPKLKGGLGIRDMEKSNLSLLAKVGWRLIHYPNSLCAKLLKAKYYPNGNPLLTTKKNNNSWVWGGIRKGLSYLEKNVYWEVGNGVNINIWKDSWIPDFGRVTPKEGWNSEEGPQLVHDLIDATRCQWKREILDNLFEHEVVRKIIQLRLLPNNHDKIHWKHSKNGLFSVKSAYNSQFNGNVIGQNPMNRENDMRDFWKKFWGVQANPRAKMFVWKCINRMIPVNHVYECILQIPTQLCVLCNRHIETINHVVYECPFVKLVWARGPTRMNLQLLDNLSIQEWIGSWFTNGNFTQLERMEWIILCMNTCWYIWKHRCDVTFDGKSVDVEEVVRAIERDAGNKNSIHIVESDREPSRQHTQIWKPCSFGLLKINVDASFNYSNLSYGVGIVARDYTGRFMGGYECGGVATSAEESEGIAAWEGVKWALARGYDQIILESDAQSITNFLKYGTGNIAWKTRSVLLDIIRLTDNMNLFYCNYIPRLCNIPADLLAKRAQTQNMRVTTYNEGDPPDLIKTALSEDVFNSFSFISST